DVHRVAHGRGRVAIARDGLRRRREHHVVLLQPAPGLRQRDAEEGTERREALAREGQVRVVVPRTRADLLLADLDQLLAEGLLLVREEPVGIEHRSEAGLGALDRYSHLWRSSLFDPSIPLTATPQALASAARLPPARGAWRWGRGHATARCCGGSAHSGEPAAARLRCVARASGPSSGS